VSKVSAQILIFKTNKRPSRLQAMRWLVVNNIEYPKDIPGEIGPNLFHGWRFIRSTDGIIYFADCISEGITEFEANQFRIACNAN
jgi:hypothetical protein